MIDRLNRAAMRLRPWGMLLLALGCVAPSARADEFADLLARGVTIGSGQVARLSPPRMANGLTAAQQQEVLKKAAGKYPLDRFLRNAVVSPFVLDMTSLDDRAGHRDGQRVDFYFVAYGTIAAIVDKDLISELAGAQESKSADPPPATARSLTPEELKSRDLSPRKVDAFEESYLAIDVPILERVQLSGVCYAIQQQTDESVLGAIRLDERFSDDPKFPNAWRPIERDTLGKTNLGSAHPYAGLCGYVKLTRLIEPAGAVFIECHIVFDEPEGWFDGKNLLRSKLPLVVQENARTFRRKLSKASQ